MGEVWDKLVDKLVEELPIITKAPFSFSFAVGAAIVLIGIILWYALRWQYRSRLEKGKAEIQLLERQGDDLKYRLETVSREPHGGTSSASVVQPDGGTSALSNGPHGSPNNRPSDLLVGVWFGVLQKNGQVGLAIHSTLIIGRKIGGAIDGLLAYEGRLGSELCYRGVDQLRRDADRALSADRTRWTPYFDRCAHQLVGKKAKRQPDVHGDGYEWTCIIDEQSNTPQMNVEIAAKTATFLGKLIKQ
jgi:hypothetical protein